MASAVEINSWFDKFAKKIITENMGINLKNPKDVERLRVPSLDGKTTKPLFENGFQNTEENREKLYQYAKNGTLFAISKLDNEAYQITEDKVNEFEKTEEKEKKKVTTAQKVGYTAVSIVWTPARFLLGLGGRVLNLVTLGLFEKQIKSVGKGLDAMTGAWSDRLYNAKQQKEDNEKKVGTFTRIGNALTLGRYKKDKIIESEFTKSRELISDAINLDRESFKAQEKENLQKKVEEKIKSRKEKELEATKEKLKELEQPIADNAKPVRDETAIQKETVSQEKNEVQNQKTEQGDKQTKEDFGKEMKSKLQYQYEEMRMAFGPGGGGFVEAVKLAQDMNQLINRLQENPEALKNSGMSKEKLKEFSNMCTNMEKIGREGLNAKSDLIELETSKKLTPEEKVQRICQMQLMNMVEKAMVNSAYASYLDNGRQPGKSITEMKSSRIFNELRKDPSVVEYEMYKGIKQLDSTEQLMEMSPEELSDYIGEPEKVRTALNEEIHKEAESVREQRQQEQMKVQQMQIEQQGLQIQGNQPKMQPPQYQIQSEGMRIGGK